MKEYVVGPEAAGQRLDVYVATHYPQFTRSSLLGLFKRGMVTANAETQKAGYKVRAGDKVQVDHQTLTSEAPDIDLPIIYEDDNVLVIDKPAGILTHSKGAINNEATVASFIKPKITDETLQGNRAGIVHRLDRHTSGVIITAKNDEAMKYLQKQFSQRKTKKIYLAVVDGDLEPTEAIIDVPILRNQKKPQTFIVNAAGKPARTAYKLIKVFEKADKLYSYVELRPETGGADTARWPSPHLWR
ncbi:RluA family pseudouridine synthase [Candidatus Saccharibacteria bacterium]|nr:RluA family pseudouridine synthase [Candidatus Saccharibacteria bacterium]